jgi:hypothetical protein
MHDDGDRHEPASEPSVSACVEHGIWTPLPAAPPRQLSAFTLRLKAVSPRAHADVKSTGVLTFHMVGCTGDPDDHAPQRSVVRAMATQIRDPGPLGRADEPVGRAAFLYHLGDVAYKEEADHGRAGDGQRDGQRALYRRQFYAPYAGYPRPIFAIAGNHDGKRTPERRTSAIDHFFARFCAGSTRRSTDNRRGRRPAMTQPYPYWRLTTPRVYVLGLYSNIANGGILDNPSRPGERPQYRWLVDQLTDVRRRNARRAHRRAIVLVVHYPPYSGAANFAQRGDPTLGPSHAKDARPLAAILQEAFAESGQRPDAVFSAHAHLYQRLTYRYADGWEVPYLVAGSGGHTPVEKLWEACDGRSTRPKKPPFAAVLPPGLELPAGDQAQVVSYNDQSYGFLRVTVTSGRLVGEFFAVGGDQVRRADVFRLDLATHRVEALVG